MINNHSEDWAFTERGCKINFPQRYRSWYNYISNDDYGLKISHTGDGYSTTLAAPRIAVSNYDFFAPVKGRYVYINDGESIWTPSFAPCCTKLDSFSCTHESGATVWESSKNGISVKQTVFVPEHGTYEIHLVSVTLEKGDSRHISIFPEMEFLLYNSFNIDPVYYSWFTDTRIDGHNTILFERRTGGLVTGFYAPLIKPDGFETSLKRFFAGGDWEKPGQVVSECLSNAMSGGDPYIGVFKYDVNLKKNETRTYAFFGGVGDGQLQDIYAKYHGVADVEKELQNVRNNWEKKLNPVWISSLASSVKKAIPEDSGINKEKLQLWLKTFFGYQIYQQSTGMVRGTFRGFRDVAQDAMAICRYDAKAARSLLKNLCTKQYTSGRCLRQWNTEGGANDERDFRDLPLWIIAALHTYERITGDSTIYAENADWIDSPASLTSDNSLWNHAIRGIEYSMQIGDHGLIKMGAGDWNDSLSGPGKDGGSVFLNEFAYWALSLAEDVSKRLNLQNNVDVPANQRLLYDNTMKYWNGKWFARAVTEDGTVLGTTAEFNGKKGDGRQFLLPQVWFTISGMAKRTKESEKIEKKALDSVIAGLETEIGVLKMSPGYDKYDKEAGNVSALAPGMAENFAIYNHAAAFASYAFFKAGRPDDAWRIIKKILPFTKDWKQTKAEPYVLVNFYNGGFYPEKKGEGGVSWLTGTINWIALCFYDFC